MVGAKTGDDGCEQGGQAVIELTADLRIRRFILAGIMLAVCLSVAFMGAAASDTRNFDNVQTGISFVTVTALNPLGDSAFIPFSPVYSRTPNVTETLVGSFIIGNIATPIYVEQTVFLDSTGTTAPTLVVPNAETEIFSNTQDRRTMDFSQITTTASPQGILWVNVVTALPAGDNGRITIQYSINNGASWVNFVACASGALMTSTGIKVLNFVPDITIAWAQQTMLRLTVCNGNGVGIVGLGGIWFELENQPFGAVFTTPQISAWNITTTGFNLEILDSIVQAVDITYQLNWVSFIPSVTCPVNRC
jgi:hypothetical protein